MYRAYTELNLDQIQSLGYCDIVPGTLKHQRQTKNFGGSAVNLAYDESLASWYLQFGSLRESDPRIPSTVAAALAELGKLTFTYVIAVMEEPFTYSVRPGCYRYKSAAMNTVSNSTTRTVSASSFEDLVEFVDLYFQGLLTPAVEYPKKQIDQPAKGLRQLAAEFFRLAKISLRMKLSAWRYALNR